VILFKTIIKIMDFELLKEAINVVARFAQHLDDIELRLCLMRSSYECIRITLPLTPSHQARGKFIKSPAFGGVRVRGM